MKNNCAFCNITIDLSDEKSFEYLEEDEVCCNPCYQTESDIGE